MPLSLPVFLLPFFFTFAVVYGALQMGGTFKPRVNAIIAVVLGLFAVSSEQVVGFINGLLPLAALFFTAVFFIGFLFSVVSRKAEKKDYTLIVVVLAMVLLFLAAQGQDLLQGLLPGAFGIDAENLVFLAGLILVALIVFAAYRAEGEGGAK